MSHWLFLTLIESDINWHIFLACDYMYTIHPLNNVVRYNNIFAITVFWRVTKGIVIAKLGCTFNCLSISFTTNKWVWDVCVLIQLFFLHGTCGALHSTPTHVVLRVHEQSCTHNSTTYTTRSTPSTHKPASQTAKANYSWGSSSLLFFLLFLFLFLLLPWGLHKVGGRRGGEERVGGGEEPTTKEVVKTRNVSFSATRFICPACMRLPAEAETSGSSSQCVTN